VDRVRLLKIVDYLLDNAIKFTDEGGINVTIESDSDWTHISVADTGIGIEEAFLPKLFTPFKQESSGLTRSHGGLGVGLAIARRMAESMGGRIAVSSNKGEGSTFVVSMPRTCAATPSALVDRAFSPGIA
jgi:signal transduction histidine kinase